MLRFEDFSTPLCDACGEGIVHQLNVRKKCKTEAGGDISLSGMWENDIPDINDKAG